MAFARVARTARPAGKKRRKPPPQYQAYAVAHEGSRQALEAHRIVVDLGGSKVEIELTVASPILAGRLTLRAYRRRMGDGTLVVGPACGNSITIGVEPSRKRRPRPA